LDAVSLPLWLSLLVALITSIVANLLTAVVRTRWRARREADRKRNVKAQEALQRRAAGWAKDPEARAHARYVAIGYQVEGVQYTAYGGLAALVAGWFLAGSGGRFDLPLSMLLGAGLGLAWLSWGLASQRSKQVANINACLGLAREMSGEASESETTEAS
jgi:hypothetical protein